MTICIPSNTDWSCKFTDTELADARADLAVSRLLDKAEAFAWSLLAALTAYRIGTCPITVRPCAAGCDATGSLYAPVDGSFAPGVIGRPYISGGRWYNACGCRSACSCDTVHEVSLPGPVGAIVSVQLDGVTLDPSAYRVDNGNQLVRTDGEPWPICQRMGAEPTEEGTFAVTYYRGAAPNLMTRAAAGVLAAEFYEACQGNPCRLPWNLQQATINGDQYDFGEGGAEGVAASFPEVAAVVRVYNPHGLKSPPVVASPDDYKARVTTWRS